MVGNVVSSTAAPRAIGAYSQAIAAGGLLFLSGQVALDPATGALSEGNAAEQTTRCLQNLRAVLAEAGIGPEQVVKTTIYLVDLADFAEVNRVYGEFFAGGPPPARSTIQVAGLPRGARVEVDAIATLGSQSDESE